MVGRELAGLVEHPTDEPHETVTTGETVLELRGVSALGDKGLPALRNVDLEIRSGETLGIAGVAGNGQRELAEVLTGLRPATDGTIRIDGKPMTNRSAVEIARAGVAHVPRTAGNGADRHGSLSENAILRAMPSRRFPAVRFCRTKRSRRSLTASLPITR